MRRRFVVATGSPAASEFGRYYLLLVFRKSLRLDDVSGATSFELVATLRFEETQVLQLVVGLTQLVVPHEVASVSQ
ncbi:hypothetical protein F511_20990 [Dorcoceras hygrometricum]|uniref:Uncharacterized protein n=1 Tax=Dorcoceras hygrometricum TaxID=472368 RepID=A0A2Z7D120_9LAMI|nr:hypothetical protein F511_20990 [Dorcoceras hygrometricum]